MKKRYILLLTATVLITLGGCAKDAENTQTSGSESVSNEQSTSADENENTSSTETEDIEASAQKARDLYASFYGFCAGYVSNEIENRYYEEIVTVMCQHIMSISNLIIQKTK